MKGPHGALGSETRPPRSMSRRRNAGKVRAGIIHVVPAVPALLALIAAPLWAAPAAPAAPAPPAAGAPTEKSAAPGITPAAARGKEDDTARLVEQARAYFASGNEHYAAGRYQEAIRHFQ